MTVQTIQQLYYDNIKKHGTLTCYLCLKPIKFDKDVIEHKTPLSRGGTNEKKNLAIADRSCNAKKHMKTETEVYVMQSQELLSAVLKARQKVVEIEGFLADANEVKKNVEVSLVEFMDNSDLKSFKDTTLNCTVIRKESLYVSIEKDKKDEAMKWIEENCGRPDLLKMSIHNKKLSSFIGQMLKKGEKIPQELFVYFFKPELTIVQAKKEA